MSAMASQITGVASACSTVCSGAHQRKHKSFVSLAFMRGIHWWPVDSPHKGLITQKMFPFDGVIMTYLIFTCLERTAITNSRKLRRKYIIPVCNLHWFNRMISYIPCNSCKSFPWTTHRQVRKMLYNIIAALCVVQIYDEWNIFN